MSYCDLPIGYFKNLKIYYNTLTNSLLMAGNLGIEEELVDKDYPTFLVHRETWAKMQEDHRKGNTINMMQIQEKQNPEKLRDQLEIRHPQLPDRMMNLHIDDIQNVKVKAASKR